MTAAVVKTSIPGCLRLQVPCMRDARGSLTKVYHAACFERAGVDFTIREVFHSVSRRGVLRGLHFQVPPADHAKAVCCLTGAVRDVVVDLRLGSPTYGRHELFRIDAENAEVVCIPRGVAHGFYVESEEATLLYFVSSMHAPASDRGVRWDSCGVLWGVENPVLSERDRNLPALADFASPFRYDKQEAVP